MKQTYTICNLALKRINSSCGHLDYGVIPDKLEPSDVTKGIIARFFFYMMQGYGLVIDGDMLTMFKQWNKNDLPNCNELKHNNIIEAS